MSSFGHGLGEMDRNSSGSRLGHTSYVARIARGVFHRSWCWTCQIERGTWPVGLIAATRGLRGAQWHTAHSAHVFLPKIGAHGHVKPKPCRET
eukprot:1104253-Amphidinium_carterae.1